MQALVDGLVGSRQAAAAGGHFEEIAARAIHFADEIDEPQVVLAIAGGLDQDSAGAVAEQDARGAVGIVDDAAHGIGADHEDLPVRAGGHQVRARGEAVDESGAGGDEIESPGATRADAVLHQAGGGGEEVVRRDRADDDGVELGRCPCRAAARAHLAASMAMSEVAISGPAMWRSRIPVRLHDPLVVGLDHLFEVLVGEHAGRSVAPQRADFGLGQVCPFLQKFRVTHPGVESVTKGACARYPG